MKQGFTLIELLAVIVILAIIAVIAVPIVLNIIDETKSNAMLKSADFYLDAVEYTISDAYLYHGGLQDGDYPITPEGNLCKTALPCSEENTLKVEVNGEVPKSGTITITNGNISGIELKYEEKTIIKNSDGDLVYQEGIVAVKLCTANTIKVKALIYQGGDPSLEESYATEEVGLLANTDGAYTPGVAYTCNFINDNTTNNMTFFVLSELEDEVTLIAGFDLVDEVEWITYEHYLLEGGSPTNWDNYIDRTIYGPVTAKKTLAQRVSTWDKLDDTQLETIKIPTKEQIENAYIGEELPKWLKSYPNILVTYGYWTSTPCDGWGAFAVDLVNDRALSGHFIGTVYGIRPVITLSKSNLQN